VLPGDEEVLDLRRVVQQRAEGGKISRAQILDAARNLIIGG
jgi:hypothetical protein